MKSGHQDIRLSRGFVGRGFSRAILYTVAGRNQHRHNMIEASRLSPSGYRSCRNYGLKFRKRSARDNIEVLIILTQMTHYLLVRARRDARNSAVEL